MGHHIFFADIRTICCLIFVEFLDDDFFEIMVVLDFLRCNELIDMLIVGVESYMGESHFLEINIVVVSDFAVHQFCRKCEIRSEFVCIVSGSVIFFSDFL